jgi:hypothetical protein
VTRSLVSVPAGSNSTVARETEMPGVVDVHLVGVDDADPGTK